MSNKGYTSAILYFYYSEWPIDIVYTTSEIADYFGLHIRHMRYYLNWLIDRKLICCIQYGGRSYYAHRWVADYFSQLSNVTIRK